VRRRGRVLIISTFTPFSSFAVPLRLSLPFLLYLFLQFHLSGLRFNFPRRSLFGAIVIVGRCYWYRCFHHLIRTSCYWGIGYEVICCCILPRPSVHLYRKDQAISSIIYYYTHLDYFHKRSCGHRYVRSRSLTMTYLTLMPRTHNILK
jgi:hypothetical protein